MLCLSLSQVELEASRPGSQDRVPGGRLPFAWAQSLYILILLIDKGFIKPSELDPLNRRLATETRPDTVVQGKKLTELGHNFGMRASRHSDCGLSPIHNDAFRAGFASRRVASRASAIRNAAARESVASRCRDARVGQCSTLPADEAPDTVALRL